MKILVTGATGLIGRKLCKEILQKGNELVVVGRANEAIFRKKFSMPCEYQNWSDLNPIGIQAVIHLAGDPIASGRWTAKKKATILNSRVQTTAKLAQAFKGKWPEIFIGASAIGIYGNRGDEKLTEDSTPGQGFLTEVCKKWEDSYQAFEQHSRLIRIRIGLVLDSEGGFLVPMKKLFSLRLGGRVANGKQWMSWIHCQDLVGILLFALENPLRGTFNGVAPQPVTNSHWTKAFADKLKVIAPFPAPGFALKIILGEMSHLALDGQNVSSEKIISQGFNFKYKDIKTALNDL